MVHIARASVLALLGLQVVACALSPEVQQISARLENMDADKILNNARILSSYVDCMVDKGPCNPTGRDLKKGVPELIRIQCSECSPKLRSTVQKTIRSIKKNYPKEWEILYNNYDPKGERKNQLEQFLKS